MILFMIKAEAESINTKNYYLAGLAFSDGAFFRQQVLEGKISIDPEDLEAEMQSWINEGGVPKDVLEKFNQQEIYSNDKNKASFLRTYKAMLNSNITDNLSREQQELEEAFRRDVVEQEERLRLQLGEAETLKRQEAKVAEEIRQRRAAELALGQKAEKEEAEQQRAQLLLEEERLRKETVEQEKKIRLLKEAETLADLLKQQKEAERQRRAAELAARQKAEKEAKEQREESLRLLKEAETRRRQEEEAIQAARLADLLRQQKEVVEQEERQRLEREHAEQGERKRMQLLLDEENRRKAERNKQPRISDNQLKEHILGKVIGQVHVQNIAKLIADKPNTVIMKNWTEQNWKDYINRVSLDDLDAFRALFQSIIG